VTDSPAIERAHHVEHRLGMMLDPPAGQPMPDPTPEQLAAAQAEADRLYPPPARAVLATPLALFQPRKP